MKPILIFLIAMAFSFQVKAQTCDVVTGDIKYGIQTADHLGWIKMDGRATSSLTATQQAAASALGIGANIPDATNKILKQKSGALFTTGGALTSTIAQANLPSFNMTATTTTDGAHTHDVKLYTTGSGANSVQIYGPTTSITTDTQTDGNGMYSAGSHTHTFTYSSGGSGTPLSTENGWLNVNQFIYLGL